MYFFFVVISHMYISEAWSVCIGSFHVPSLFVVSGFLYKEKSVTQIFKSLYIPVFIITLVI